jgi:hypothetical protein
VDSNYEVINDATFARRIPSSKEFDKFRSRMNIKRVGIQANFSDELLTGQYVYIFKCDISKSIMYSRLSNGHPVRDYYYEISEIMSWIYMELEASYLNPFIDRFQYLMDLSFQAGLPQMWTVFVRQISNNLRRTFDDVDDEKQFLELSDLLGIFVIYFALCGLAVVAFFGEIFWHDCLGNLRFNCIVSSIKNKLKCCRIKDQNSKVKVRKIIVRPRPRVGNLD